MDNILNKVSLLSHRDIYYFSLVFLAISLPLSIFTTTLAEIILFINWLWEGNFGNKFLQLKDRKGALIFSLIYILHLIGLLYTEDFNFGLHDLKIKLPILVLPVIIASSPVLKEKELRNLLILFSLAVFAGSIVSGAIYFGITEYQYLDYRDISIFISHIRMALMVNLALFCLLYYVINPDIETVIHPKFRVPLILIILWLIFFLFILKSLTGLVVFLIVSFILGWKYSGNIGEIAPRFIIRVLLITIPLIIASYLSHSAAQYFYRDKIDISSLDKFTAKGNSYSHDVSNKSAENGHYVYLYVCEKELMEEWNNKSDIQYDEKDRKGQELKFTLIRYMTSKNLRKDAEGIRQLTYSDIEAVENGLTNYIFLDKNSLHPRIYEILWELDSYKKGNDPSGHSVAQRLAYLKAAKEIISKNPLVGVGTGDVKMEFDSYYKSSGSLLNQRWWNRAHNQYITFLITFGCVGFVIVLISFFYPIFLEKRWGDYLFLCFALIGFISMLNEDTLETQTGVSFFVFFYSLFLFGRSKVEYTQKI